MTLQIWATGFFHISIKQQRLHWALPYIAKTGLNKDRSILAMPKKYIKKWWILWKCYVVFLCLPIAISDECALNCLWNKEYPFAFKRKLRKPYEFSFQNLFCYTFTPAFIRRRDGKSETDTTPGYKRHITAINLTPSQCLAAKKLFSNMMMLHIYDTTGGVQVVY